jgi:hypothetical protein
VYRPDSSTAAAGPATRQSGGEHAHNKPQTLNEGDHNLAMMDYETVQCGYGKLMWPDQSTFEGYWINGFPCGIGVFRSGRGGQMYEGFW